MSTTACERGDILLISVPIGEEMQMRLRPVLAARKSESVDSHVYIVPLTADPMVECNSILVPLGSFESARMGLVSSAYLNTVEEIPVPRQALIAKIGRCPHRLLHQFLGMYRSAKSRSGCSGLSLVERSAQPGFAARPSP